MFTQTKILIAVAAIISFLAIVGVHLYNDSNVRDELAAAKLLNLTREATIKALTDTRKAEIEAATKAAEVITKAAIDEKNAALTELGLEHINRLELTKRIEALNETHNRKLADTKFNFNERLRLEGINSATAIRQESERYANLPKTASECDGIIADYDTLKQACQLTTIDLNTCGREYEADTAACGRKQ